MDGVLNVYKEKGWTSFDVVAKLRGILKTKRIGHAGTLDPDAEGVLVVCVGRGTKLVDRLMDHDKEYETVMLLGRKTDTGDITGRTIAEAEVLVTEEGLRSAVLSFVPGYDQIPPMYSALKVKGKRLYEYAREGIEVEREARHVSIPRLQIREIELPRVSLLVECGRGTYIRALCEDIGEKLSLPACMESLRRTRVGAFSLSDARKLSEIEEMAAEGRAEELLVPVDQVQNILTVEKGKEGKGHP